MRNIPGLLKGTRAPLPAGTRRDRTVGGKSVQFEKQADGTWEPVKAEKTKYADDDESDSDSKSKIEEVTEKVKKRIEEGAAKQGKKVEWDNVKSPKKEDPTSSSTPSQDDTSKKVPKADLSSSVKAAPKNDLEKTYDTLDIPKNAVDVKILKNARTGPAAVYTLNGKEYATYSREFLQDYRQQQWQRIGENFDKIEAAKEKLKEMYCDTDLSDDERDAAAAICISMETGFPVSPNSGNGKSNRFGDKYADYTSKLAADKTAALGEEESPAATGDEAPPAPAPEEGAAPKNALPSSAKKPKATPSSKPKSTISGSVAAPSENRSGKIGDGALMAAQVQVSSDQTKATINYQDRHGHKAQGTIADENLVLYILERLETADGRSGLLMDYSNSIMSAVMNKAGLDKVRLPDLAATGAAGKIAEAIKGTSLPAAVASSPTALATSLLNIGNRPFVNSFGKKAPKGTSPIPPAMMATLAEHNGVPSATANTLTKAKKQEDEGAFLRESLKKSCYGIDHKDLKLHKSDEDCPSGQLLYWPIPDAIYSDTMDGEQAVEKALLELFYEFYPDEVLFKGGSHDAARVGETREINGKMWRKVREGKFPEAWEPANKKAGVEEDTSGVAPGEEAKPKGFKEKAQAMIAKLKNMLLARGANAKHVAAFLQKMFGNALASGEAPTQTASDLGVEHPASNQDKTNYDEPAFTRKKSDQKNTSDADQPTAESTESASQSEENANQEPTGELQPVEGTPEHIEMKLGMKLSDNPRIKEKQEKLYQSILASEKANEARNIAAKNAEAATQFAVQARQAADAARQPGKGSPLAVAHEEGDIAKVTDLMSKEKAVNTAMNSAAAKGSKLLTKLGLPEFEFKVGDGGDWADLDSGKTTLGNGMTLHDAMEYAARKGENPEKVREAYAAAFNKTQHQEGTGGHNGHALRQAEIKITAALRLGNPPDGSFQAAVLKKDGEALYKFRANYIKEQAASGVPADVAAHKFKRLTSVVNMDPSAIMSALTVEDVTEIHGLRLETEQKPVPSAGAGSESVTLSPSESRRESTPEERANAKSKKVSGSALADLLSGSKPAEPAPSAPAPSAPAPSAPAPSAPAPSAPSSSTINEKVKKPRPEDTPLRGKTGKVLVEPAVAKKVRKQTKTTKSLLPSSVKLNSLWRK